MDWGDLRYFVALAKRGTLSGAARDLGAEHTTVARRITALEDALGVRLFERGAKGYALTPEGERIVENAYRIEDEVFGLQRQIASGALGLSGTVRISAPPAFASNFLIPHLAELRRSHPGIILEIAGENHAVSLSRREADIAVRMGRPEPASVVARQIGRLGYGLYGTRDYLSQVAEPDWVFVAYDERLDHTLQQRWLLSIVDDRPLVFRANDLPGLLAAVTSGIGLGVLPRFLGDSNPTLQRLPMDASPAARELWLVVHPDMRRSPRVRAVLDFLAEMVRSSRNILDPEPSG